MVEKAAFDPSKYLTKVSGADYLEVKWRLVWLRAEHPDASIETSLVNHDGVTAIFRAHVRIPGAGEATGWGSESSDDFRDYLEKAETKALGRALAALGFGTQFCPDFEFGAAQNRVVDTPVDIRRTRMQSEAESGQPTPRQIRFMRAIAEESGLSEEELEQEAQEMFGKPMTSLLRREASTLIEHLQQRRASIRAAS